MPAMRETPTPEVLLEHQGFVSALARCLLFDEHAAADIVQETWKTALDRPGCWGACSCSADREPCFATGPG